jgi:predicted Rossmann-fold nucleotide-binding protein
MNGSRMIVGVMASGHELLATKHDDLAKQVGRAIARLGFHLLTGGGGGLMSAVGRAFLDEKRKILKAKGRAGILIASCEQGSCRNYKKMENATGKQTQTMDLAK